MGISLVAVAAPDDKGPRQPRQSTPLAACAVARSPAPRTAPALCCRPLLAPIPVSPVASLSTRRTAGTDGEQGAKSLLFRAPRAAEIDVECLSGGL